MFAQHQDVPCLHLEKHEWFVHLDVYTYFFRANVYYVLERLSIKHEKDWLTVNDEKVSLQCISNAIKSSNCQLSTCLFCFCTQILDFRSQGEYLGLPNFSDHIAHNAGFFFMLSKQTVDSLTTALRSSKKRGGVDTMDTRCSWSKGNYFVILA